MQEKFIKKLKKYSRYDESYDIASGIAYIEKISKEFPIYEEFDYGAIWLSAGDGYEVCPIKF
jgi:hypothetical protein